MAKRKKDNEDPDPDNLNQSDDSADNFGLPDVEYKPLDRTEPVPPEAAEETEREVERSKETFRMEPSEEHVDYLEDEDEPRSNAPVIISIIIVLVVAIAGILIWKYWYVPKAAKEKKELADKQLEESRKKEEAARIAREQEAAEQKRLADEAAAKAKPVEGSIATLSERTNRFYVVIASDIDGDLIMDYAKRLSAKGVSTKIVAPYGTTKFSRLTMGDYDSYAAAQSAADASKAEYGNTCWVIKY